ncbi:MAG: permease of phosphate ABC transporter [Candidatus Spyradocola sp.]
MKRIFDAANRYCRQSDWKTLAALKICLLALGVIIGLLLPDACRVPVVIVCAVIFAATCAPLVAKYVRILRQK